MQCTNRGSAVQSLGVLVSTEVLEVEDLPFWAITGDDTLARNALRPAHGRRKSIPLAQ